MNIQVGKQYINKTWSYLIPSLRGHGDDFVNHFNPVFKLAAGIHDTMLDGSPMIDGNTVYLMLDKKHNNDKYDDFMEFIQKQSYYIGDYCADVDVMNAFHQTVIIQIPDMFAKSYDMFLQSRFSEMYEKEHLDIFFKNKKLQYEVLSKTGETALNNFLITVKETFNTNVSKKDLNDAEWELPLIKKEEIFNYQDSDTIYFDVNKDKLWQ